MINKKMVKIKATSSGTLFHFCLPQQLFANKGVCMETRLGNIFKTTNILTLTKVILEILFISFIKRKDF